MVFLQSISRRNHSRSANSLLYFINTTFNYPAMAEAYRVPALKWVQSRKLINAINGGIHVS